MPTKITKGKPLKLSKKDHAILSALPEEYQRALLYFHKAQAEEATQHGHQPMPFTQFVQTIIFDWLKDTAKRDEVARVAFEIAIAPQFILSLKAWYEAGMPEVPDGR
jgi:hypothetical protein